jgi:hypothetical protein
MTPSIEYLLAFATIALAACDSSPASSSFNYDLTRSSNIDIEAHDSSGPLSGVVVSVRGASPGPDLTGDLLWMGATGTDGHARATIRTNLAGDSLDVTLHKSGWSGPWTDAALRTSEGIAAPSARLSVPIAQAEGMQVDLERSN